MSQHPTPFGPFAREALDALKARPWPIVGAACLYAGALGGVIASALAYEEFARWGDLSEEARLALALGLSPVLFALQHAAWLTSIHVALRTLRREPIDWSAGLRALGPGLVVNALVQAMCVVGLLACVVPAFALGVGLAFSQWFLVDRALGPFAALGASWDATRGLRVSVFVLLVAFVVLLGLGAAVTFGAGLPLTLAMLLLMGASSHERLAARVFTPRATPAQEPGGPTSPAPLEAPATPVPTALWAVGAAAGLATVGLWDPDAVRWLFRVLSQALPGLERPQVQAALVGAVAAPGLVVLVVGLRIHARHRAVALDARGVWLDATPRDGRLVPWADVEWFDVVGDGVRLKLRRRWSGLAPVVALDEARRPEAVALLEGYGVQRREG